MGYKVVEKFISINGEGKNAGKLAAFIRFKGCNLTCSYCDTMWANQANTPYEELDSRKIIEYIIDSGVKYVTLTGGEPLLQEGIGELIEELSKVDDVDVEIETNGSVSIEPFLKVSGKRPSFTVDYKSISSDMNQSMFIDNFYMMGKDDTLKFVVGDRSDLEDFYNQIMEHNLTDRTNVYLSPIFDNIEPKDIVEFMKDRNLVDVTFQIQLHKVIWDPSEKGV